jgi:hypothetical protein
MISITMTRQCQHPTTIKVVAVRGAARGGRGSMR